MWWTRAAAWAMTSQQCQANYTGKLRDAGLQLGEFEGFDGRDDENLRIIKRRLDLLATMKLVGINETEVQEYLDLFGPMYEAWSNGAFVLKRSCAERD